MPKITITPDGIKGAVAAGMNRQPPKRGTVKGWTSAVARRNRDFLMSVDAASLDGQPISASLTFGRDYPLSPQKLAEVRHAFIKRCARKGMIRLHWVTEFQRDGTPHLHCMIYFDHTRDAANCAAWVRHDWLEVAEFSGASITGQHVVSTHHLLGWKKYLAKHGARSAEHYQRVMPKGWEKPGRMWGKSGKWPTVCVELESDRATFFAIRRRARAWRVAQARNELQRKIATSDPLGVQIAKRCLVQARAMLRCHDPRRSEMRGFAEWIPDAVSVELVRDLATKRGAMVRDWAEREVLPPDATQPPERGDPKYRSDRGAGHTRNVEEEAQR